MAREWVIYYGDDTIFTSDDGEVWDIPKSGVQVVVVADNELGYRNEVSRAGYWSWRDGTWYGHDDEMGFWDYIRDNTLGHAHTVLFGRTLSGARWGELMKRASVDIKIGKSAWSQRERRREP